MKFFNFTFFQSDFYRLNAQGSGQFIHYSIPIGFLIAHATGGVAIKFSHLSALTLIDDLTKDATL